MTFQYYPLTAYDYDKLYTYGPGVDVLLFLLSLSIYNLCVNGQKTSHRAVLI